MVVGEAVVDRVKDANGIIVRETPGGSPANVAVGIATLGRRTRLVTELGLDQAGDLLRDHFARAGVEVEEYPTPSGRTSTAAATLDAEGAASYEFDLDFDLPAEGNEIDLTNVLHFHIGSVSAVLTPHWDAFVSLVERASRSAVVSYDLNLRPALTGVGPEVVARVETLMRLAHLVKASDEDLAALWPDLDLNQAMAAVMAYGPGSVIVTRGRAGASLLTRDGITLVASAAKIGVIDTIGAGDSFMAGALDAMASARTGAYLDLGNLGAKDWQEILEHAIRTSAFTVSRPGASAPQRSDVGEAFS